ncbi:MAG: MerR family transcriptional regulator [Alphaproteobacteria bacterium]|nr:MerR family transcriptional regulator [Alphaproteobacteria bacterium]
MNKSKSAFKTIAEVAEELGVATHVLRFWETKFNQIKPMKASGGRRYYRPDDVEILRLIRNLLYNNRYTIEGAQNLIKNRGLKNLLGSEGIQKDFFTDEEGVVSETVAPVSVSQINETHTEIRKIVSSLKDLRAALKKI